MTINVQAVNFNAKPGLEDYLRKKLAKLETLTDKIISAQVLFKLENTAEKNSKNVEVKLEVPGEDIVVKKNGQTFEECIDLSVDTLKKLVIKMKEKNK